MWRTAIATFGILAAQAASAQQTMDEALEQLQVFDCVLGEAQVIYVFQTDADGMISLVGDAAAPVRMGEKGISLMTADGAREIGDGTYNVYKDGTAESGTCTDATALAHTIYPALTAAYAPDAEGDTVAEQAAAAGLKDLTTRVNEAEARMITAETALSKALASAKAAETERDELRVLAETQSNTIAASKAELDDITATYEEAIAWLDAERGKTETLTADLAVTSGEYEEAIAWLDAERGTTEQLTAEVEKLKAVETDLEELRTLHKAVATAASEFQGQLTETTGKLTIAEQSRRSLVATVASLNAKITDLGQELKTVRAARDEALAEAKAAGARARSVGGLTDAAIARVATLQGRSKNAVRSELCRLIGRGANCGR